MPHKILCNRQPLPKEESAKITRWATAPESKKFRDVALAISTEMKIDAANEIAQGNEEKAPGTIAEANMKMNKAAEYDVFCRIFDEIATGEHFKVILTPASTTVASPEKT